MSTALQYNINPLVSAIGKMPEEFTKEDIINFITANDIRVVNFRYIAGDGRLKTLNFPVSSLQYLDLILSFGERVDGSSLFSYIEAGSSDLYVIPRFSTAYIDPFAEIPTLGMLCSYFTKDGLPLESSPEYTLRKAHEEFKKTTGYTFEAMGELEFYVIYDDDNCFPSENQRGYHESTPFTKVEAFRTEAMKLISQVGGNIKYAHSEVGNFTLDRPAGDGQMDSPHPGMAVRLRHHIRTQDHRGQGRKRTALPYPHHERGALSDAQGRTSLRRGTQGHRRLYRFRKCKPYLILPSGTSSGGSNQHLLG